jgi:hypothetical protein
MLLLDDGLRVENVKLYDPISTSIKSIYNDANEQQYEAKDNDSHLLIRELLLYVLVVAANPNKAKCEYDPTPI